MGRTEVQEEEEVSRNFLTVVVLLVVACMEVGMLETLVSILRDEK
jgi:hypothetical protein